MKMLKGTTRNIALLLVFVSWQSILAQLLSFGRCPVSMKRLPEASFHDLNGTWYEYSRYPVAYDPLHRCISYRLDTLTSGDVRVIRSSSNVVGVRRSIQGIAKLKKPYKLSVRYQNLRGIQLSTTYWVIATDKENFLIWYYCNTAGLFYSDHVEILTRARKPTEDVIENAQKAIIALGYSTDKLLRTGQDMCDSDDFVRESAPLEAKNEEVIEKTSEESAEDETDEEGKEYIVYGKVESPECDTVEDDLDSSDTSEKKHGLTISNEKQVQQTIFDDKGKENLKVKVIGTSDKATNKQNEEFSEAPRKIPFVFTEEAHAQPNESNNINAVQPSTPKVQQSSKESKAVPVEIKEPNQETVKAAIDLVDVGVSDAHA